MTMSMPAPEFLTVNGVQLAVYEAGPADSPYTPLLLLHGFPEIAFSWRRQIAALAGLGFRVIAPDQRGYGLSEAPGPVAAYDLEALTGDLFALLDARGIDRAVFVGHDWGGLVAWAAPLRRPERVAGVIGVNTPFTKRAPADPIALYRRRFGEDMYIVRFQPPGEAEALLEADLEKTFRFFFRRPDPAAASPDTRALSMAAQLAAFDPASCTRQLLSPEALAVYVAAYRRSGFRGPINWYRNFTRNWEAGAHLADHVPCPALMIVAELDHALPPSAAEGMEKYVPDLEKILFRGCGHWTQAEQPEALTAAIADWVHRRFG